MANCPRVWACTTIIAKSLFHRRLAPSNTKPRRYFRKRSISIPTPTGHATSLPHANVAPSLRQDCGAYQHLIPDLFMRPADAQGSCRC